jgi:hypothetical protein
LQLPLLVEENVKKTKPKNKRQFDVALSFAGEDRNYVEKVADALRQMGLKVFYDKYEKLSLWGKDLYDHLQEVYQHHARYTVIFVSNHYAKKLWTNHERKSAQARALRSNEEYILPARFDRSIIPGLLPTIGYVNLKQLKPKEFADLVRQKVGPIARNDFIPDDLDLLYAITKARNLKQRKEISRLAHDLFDSFKLMTFEEKKLLVTAAQEACPNGLPNNIHLDVERFSRVASIPIENIISILSRLDCLGIRSRSYLHNNRKDTLCKANRIVEIKYLPLIDVEMENATYVLSAIIEAMTTNLCPECVTHAIKNNDFSILSSRVGFADK